MQCLCATNTLRLFIRSIAHFDVAVSAHQTRRQFWKAPIRNFTSIRSKTRLATSSLIQTRASSSAQAAKKNEQFDGAGFGDAFLEISSESIDGLAAELTAFDKSLAVDDGSRTRLERSSYGSDARRKPRSGRPSDSIDGEYNSKGAKTSYSVRDGARSGKSLRAIERSRAEEGIRRSLPTTRSKNTDGISRTTIRRTKVENTGFTLHYSAPRAPLIQKPPPTSRASESDKSPFFRPSEDSPATASSAFSDLPSGVLEPLASDLGDPNVKPPNIRFGPALSNSKEKAAKDVDEEDDGWKPPPREPWQIQKAALKEKFPDGWKPLKRLSPDALAGIRALHAQMPELYTTTVLAEHFKSSPEAMRRILKSNWTPSADEQADRERRWFNRGKSIYEEAAELGYKSPKIWREAGVGKERPYWLKKKEEWQSWERITDGRPKAGTPALVTTARKLEAKRAATASFTDELL